MIAAYGFHVWQQDQGQGQAGGLHEWDAYSRYQFARAKNAT
jgi:hypothetical protein